MRELEANEFVMPRACDRLKLLASVTAFCLRLTDKKPWMIVVKPWRNDRTEKQNKALWGLAYAVLADFTGHSKDEIHDAMLRRYFGEVEKEILGVKIKVPRRTTTTDENGKRRLIDTMHLKDYFQFIQQWGAENLGAYIPDPDPNYWQETAREKAARERYAA